MFAGPAVKDETAEDVKRTLCCVFVGINFNFRLHYTLTCKTECMLRSLKLKNNHEINQLNMTMNNG